MEKQASPIRTTANIATVQAMSMCWWIKPSRESLRRTWSLTITKVINIKLSFCWFSVIFIFSAESTLLIIWGVEVGIINMAVLWLGKDLRCWNESVCSEMMWLCGSTWTNETKLWPSLLSHSSLHSVLSSSTCHPVITSPPPPPPLCRLSRRQKGSHPPQLNEWFNKARETHPLSQKDGGKSAMPRREGGKRWQKEEVELAKRVLVTVREERVREREREWVVICRLERVIQLNNVWLFSVPQPISLTKRQRCNHHFNPFFISAHQQGALSLSGQTPELHCGQITLGLDTRAVPSLCVGLPGELTGVLEDLAPDNTDGRLFVICYCVTNKPGEIFPFWQILAFLHLSTDLLLSATVENWHYWKNYLILCINTNW